MGLADPPRRASGDEDEPALPNQRSVAARFAIAIPTAMALKIDGVARLQVELATVRDAERRRNALATIDCTASRRADIPEPVGLAGRRADAPGGGVATARRIGARARSRRAGGQRLRSLRTAEFAVRVTEGPRTVAGPSLRAGGTRPDAPVRAIDAAGIGPRDARPADPWDRRAAGAIPDGFFHRATRGRAGQQRQE